MERCDLRFGKFPWVIWDLFLWGQGRRNDFKWKQFKDHKAGEALFDPCLLCWRHTLPGTDASGYVFFTKREAGWFLFPATWWWQDHKDFFDLHGCTGVQRWTVSKCQKHSWTTFLRYNPVLCMTFGSAGWDICMTFTREALCGWCHRWQFSKRFPPRAPDWTLCGFCAICPSAQRVTWPKVLAYSDSNHVSGCRVLTLFHRQPKLVGMNQKHVMYRALKLRRIIVAPKRHCPRFEDCPKSRLIDLSQPKVRIGEYLEGKHGAKFKSTLQHYSCIRSTCSSKQYEMSELQ